MSQAELSVIIPTLNEESNIVGMLEMLGRQQNICLEVIVADGGSHDRTTALVETYSAKNKLDIKIIHCEPGRALQMNLGAEAAGAQDLLFLHADTRLDDANMLKAGLVFLDAQRNTLGHSRLAGHFGMRFERSENKPSPAYYFYESKTRLNRLDTVNGDQGYMLGKLFFRSLGGFDASLAYMEDARLARKIFHSGQWITLPGTVTTSARRFESEGLKQRQTLNALLCNFDHIGLTEFFQRAATAYSTQDNTKALNLKPFLELVHDITTQAGFTRSARLWYETGAYVAANAWQLAFAIDCRRNRINGKTPGHGPTQALDFFDTWLAPVVNSPPGRFIAMTFTFIWFYGLLLLLRIR